MPRLNPLPQNREMITKILDTPSSPVAMFRLLSGGVSPNNLLENSELIVGQKACLACGNCVDACPVVLREEDKIDLQVHRTSLHLEIIVEESCLRCYSCIKVCPQVDRPLKLLAAKHRITEKLVHAWIAVVYLLTAGTGIFLNHFRGDSSDFLINLDSTAHKIGAIMWLLAPVLFYFFDKYHFKRTMKGILSLGTHDFTWWKETIKALFSKGKRPFQGEYNSGQKTWYLVVLGTMLVLGVSGMVRWIWADSLSTTTLNLIIWIHVLAAYTIDISFVYHFGRKLLTRSVKKFRQIFRDSLILDEQTRQDQREGTPASLQKTTMVLKS
ncbi:cytochrome b/b6 domain-containing protein [Desulfosporosinus sp. BICA1-9]|uniref:cytochrome b/b6 domain-containing protein n=1 Tax=Desulfosporosinus sp. BICA1-9 TaxID=1531958 RepID=UPI00054BC331|nr:cytochrome b/b6 domain-containing protein [Desulfosporosinus sp. BICA1-9]KJS46841.1 MAG: hypothetical protein VR66_23170 [Peptococcaceae bacterium BRH_c23]KJS80103.1 MAG: hypothetical protein JL57_28760 [Desulfosporosinus sp. BICA1-9]